MLLYSVLLFFLLSLVIIHRNVLEDIKGPLSEYFKFENEETSKHNELEANYLSKIDAFKTTIHNLFSEDILSSKSCRDYFVECIIKETYKEKTIRHAIVSNDKFQRCKHVPKDITCKSLIDDIYPGYLLYFQFIVIIIFNF